MRHGQGTVLAKVQQSLPSSLPKEKKKHPKHLLLAMALTLTLVLVLCRCGWPAANEISGQKQIMLKVDFDFGQAASHIDGGSMGKKRKPGYCGAHILRHFICIFFIDQPVCAGAMKVPHPKLFAINITFLAFISVGTFLDFLFHLDCHSFCIIYGQLKAFASEQF